MLEGKLRGAAKFGTHSPGRAWRAHGKMDSEEAHLDCVRPGGSFLGREQFPAGLRAFYAGLNL